MSELKITYKKLTEIRPYERNPRDNEAAVDPVAESLQAFGFLVPIVVDNENVIVAGHTRYLAARKLGLDEVPTVSADDLTKEQVKAFRLADNKVGELAVWDLPLLDEALEDIGDTMDMTKFGFTLGIGDVYEPNNSGTEYDEGDFGDDQFDYECPDCGFRFNDKE